MEIALGTREALNRVITGEGNISPYRSGPDLISFFNSYENNDSYGQGFPSRKDFTKGKLKASNGTAIMKSIIEGSVDPRDYLNNDFNVSVVVEYLNKYLVYDGFEIVKNGLYYQVKNKIDLSLIIPEFVNRLSSQKVNHAFILEQNVKCREKLNSGDYDGAITNARSMVEAVFNEILLQAGKDIPNHDGDLNKLYKNVKKVLNLDPDQKNLDEILKQILSGLITITSGISGISNKMGDRHAREYKPVRHHALLAVNAAYSICDFLIASMEYQKMRQLKYFIGTVKE